MRLTSTFLGVTCLSLMAAAGCGGSNGGSPDAATASCPKGSATGTDTKYVTNNVLLPLMTGQYGIDIDGDGKVDNQLATLTSLVAGTGSIDLTTPITQAVQAGDLLIGMGLTAANLTDACASVTANLLQKPANPPKLDGTDKLTIDSTQATANLYGGIGAMAGSINGTPVATGELFTIAPPQQVAANVTTISLNVPLGSTGGTLPLSITGAHIQGTVSSSGVMSGQIHGVISQTDVTNKIIPAIATLISHLINTDSPGDQSDSTAQTIIGLFEIAGSPASVQKCMTAANCCGVAGPKHPSTCIITPAELQAQPLIGSFLASDVQVFDANGNWAPVTKTAAGASWKPNGLSVGIGFTAVDASF